MLCAADVSVHVAHGSLSVSMASAVSPPVTATRFGPTQWNAASIATSISGAT